MSDRRLRLVHSVDKPETVALVEAIEQLAEYAGLDMQPWQRELVDYWVNLGGGTWLTNHT